MSFEDIQERNVRVIHIRPDGLMTLENVWILYKSDEVIEFYEQLQGECAGERDEVVVERIREQKEINTEKAIFFVSLYSLKDDWAFTIKKDGYIYKTAEVKAVDLDRNYKAIFGPTATRYRQNIYQVTFDIAIEPPFTFVMCNGEYVACTEWN